MSEREINWSELDREYAGLPTEGDEFDPVPDGDYQAIVHRVELVHAKTSGNPMLKWTLKILGPKFRGRLLWRNSVLKGEQLRYLKTDLHICGVELAKLSDLQSSLGRLLDVKLEVAKRTKGDFENIYFNRRIVEHGNGANGGFDEQDKVPF